MEKETKRTVIVLEYGDYPDYGSISAGYWLDKLTQLTQEELDMVNENMDRYIIDGDILLDLMGGI